MLLLLCDASARHRSPLATTELSTSFVLLSYVADKFMLPLRPREPPGGAEGVVATAGGPVLADEADAPAADLPPFLLPGVAPAPE